MSFAEPIARAGAPLARRNPVAKIVAAVALTFTLIATVDPVAPAIALAAELAVVPRSAWVSGAFLRRAGPLLLGAASVTVAMVLFAAERTGTEMVAVGPVVVTTGVLVAALGPRLAVAGGVTARHNGLRHHRCDRPRGCAHPKRPDAAAVRDRRARGVPARTADGRRVADARLRPARARP